MDNFLCSATDLVSESDTEQKFIMPLLTGAPPCGLGFSVSEILTKKTIHAQMIGKGSSQKMYVPDYILSLRGIPVAIIEAKAPKGLRREAFYEAQLYAHALNMKFKHGCNPCKLILATDGQNLHAGFHDSSTPLITMTLEDFSVGNTKYEKLRNFFDKPKLVEVAQEYYKKLKSDSRFIKPVSQLGTRLAQNQEIPANSFGQQLAFDYQHIFTPDTEQDKMNIVENAYVHSKRREHHADPIYAIVKRDISPLRSIPLVDTENPSTLVNKIEEQVKRKKSLVLLVGSKGSGKSTFIRHLYAKKLIPSVRDATQWIYIDMNNANMDNPYTWIAGAIYKKLEESHEREDFNSLETIKNVFKEEILNFDKGLGGLLRQDSDKYNSKLYEHLLALIEDVSTKLQQYVNYFLTKKNKTAIIVFDNCDKLDSEGQLKTFSVAEWLRDSFPFLIVMPIRDSTYDNYHTQPPLDTIIKDLVFRIDPPDFFKVLQERLNFMLFLNKKEGEREQKAYDISDSARVVIGKNEYIFYFKSILASIRNNNYVKGIFYGLAGRNIRLGIEIFLNFCRSGHIQANNFFKMRTSDESYSLPQHIFINALMRMNRKYYSSTSSPVKNLFSSNFTDIPPDPFARLDILNLLAYVRRNPQRYENRHFITVNSLFEKLAIVGHDSAVIMRELESLIASDLVIYESKTSTIESRGLVSISSSGSQHINLLGNIVYLAACSEDTYYRDSGVASAISERIKYQAFENKIMAYRNAKDLIGYLNTYKNATFAAFEETAETEDETKELLNLTRCLNCLDKFDQKNIGIKQIEEYQSGMRVEFRVASAQSYGLLGFFDGAVQGFVHVSKIDPEIMGTCEEGDSLLTEIIEYNIKHARFQLKYIDRIW